MASRTLTERFVETVKPEAKDQFYWHTARIQQNVRLGLKVTPAGKKVFVLQFRAVGGRRDVARRMTLSATDLKGAEREARRLFNKHQDPAQARHEERRAATVRELLPQFLDELAGLRKARTIYETTRILGGEHEGVTHSGYVLEELGNLRVRDVTTAMVQALHRRVRNATNEPRPIMANRVLAALSAFFSWCEKRGDRPKGSNPAGGVERFPETARERFLDGAELSRLNAALVAAETTGLRAATKLRRANTNEATKKHRPKNADAPRVADPVAVAAIRFLMLTGMREQEALSLRWDAVNFTRGEVTLDDTKTGKSVRPLGAPALALLDTLPRTGAYVFPGAVPEAPRREIKRVWYAVREAAKLDGLRLHDLRHTVASFAASSGSSMPMVAALLGHKTLKSTQRYAHLFDQAKRETADRAAGDIHAAMMGTTTPVTPLRVAK